MAISTNIVVFAVAAIGGLWMFCFVLWFALRRLRVDPVQKMQQASVGSDTRFLSRFRVGYRAKIRMLNLESGLAEEPQEARVIDLSEFGARIRFGSELPVGTRLRFRIPEMKSAWTAEVRNCTKGSFGYQIGLELHGSPYPVTGSEV